MGCGSSRSENTVTGENAVLARRFIDPELENGVDDEILLTEAHYPDCEVPRQTPNPEIMDYYSLEGLGKRVDPRIGTYQELANDITSVKDNLKDIQKVRLLLIWMRTQKWTQKIESRKYRSDVRNCAPLGYLKKMKEGTGTFAGLLAQLCRAVDIPCIIIKGYCKTALHNSGTNEVRKNKCTWNAVHVDGEWQIVHPLYICTTAVSETSTVGWTLVKRSEQRNPQNEDGLQHFSWFFFAPEPWNFIHICCPIESMSSWQLLDEELSFTEFLRLPFLRPAFYDCGLVLLSKRKRGLETIRIKSGNNRTLINYHLFSSSNNFNINEERRQFVYCEQTESVWNIFVHCNSEGVYKLALYAWCNSQTFWVADFIIRAEAELQRTIDPLGPSRKTQDAGLLCASYKEGIIRFIPNETHVIKFIVNKSIKTDYELDTLGSHRDLSLVYLEMTLSKNELNFVFSIPFEGQCLLKIYICHGLEEKQVVCIYWLKSVDLVKTRESGFQRKARRDLRAAMAECNQGILEEAIEKFKKSKLSAVDEDCLQAKRRLQYLQLKKGLRDAYLRQNEETLISTIYNVQCSEFVEALQPSLQRCLKLLDKIRQGDDGCHPVQIINQNTISELANYTYPPHEVHSIMKATYLLLGEKIETLESWANIQGLLRCTNKGVKYRMTEFQNIGSKVSKKVERQVKHCLKGIERCCALSVSLSATAFYDWVSKVLQENNQKERFI